MFCLPIKSIIVELWSWAQLAWEVSRYNGKAYWRFSFIFNIAIATVIFNIEDKKNAG